MTEQQKTNKIARITQQLAALKEQTNKANAETKAHIEKRDKLNEQFGKVRQGIYELVNERNGLNEAVKTLKQERDQVRTVIQANIEEIKMHRQKLIELKKKTPKQGHQELQEEFTDIEWKIQTTSLDLQEEKRLIENVKQLEEQLNVYKKIEQHDRKITELRKGLSTLQARKELLHKELTDKAQKSQEIHTAMLTKISESRSIKSEADGLHNAYLLAREKARPLTAEIRRLTEQRAKMQQSIREEDERKKKTAENALKEMLGAQAKEKLQRGEKLSWDEFRLLADDDSQTQD